MTLADAKVESEGTVLLPGRLFGDVVRSLPPGEVTLALRAEQRDVELDRRRRALSPADAARRGLPAPAGARGRAPSTLPGGPLAETIDRVARAASRDEVRPILTGVLVPGRGHRR